MIKPGKKYVVNKKVNKYIDEYSWNSFMRKNIGKKVKVLRIDEEPHTKKNGRRKSEATIEQINSGLINVAYLVKSKNEGSCWDYIPIECLDNVEEKINKLLTI